MKKKRFHVGQIVAVVKQSDQVRERKPLQEENARRRKLVAELSLGKAILQDVAQKQ